MNEKKELKQLVTTIMEQKNIVYDEWLHAQHMNFVAENSPMIISAIKKNEIN